MTYESAVAAVWPEVAEVARGELRRLRLPSDVVEDIVQDAAAVVLRRKPQFACADDLAPYVRVVVRHMGYRWTRQRGREVVGGLPEVPVVHSVPELAEHRLRLRGTARALASLPTDDRMRLSSYLVAETRVGDARQRARERKQIERIRVTLSRVAEGMAAAVGWTRHRLRWFEAAGPQGAGAVALAFTGIVALIIPTVTSQPSASSSGSSVAAGPQAVEVQPIVYAAPAPAPPPPERPRPTPPPRAGSGEEPPKEPDRTMVRVTVPTGGDAGWRRDENPTGEALICVTRRSTGERTCVDLLVPVPDL